MGHQFQKIVTSLIGKTVKAGDVLGWAGDTGPGGCGCMSGGDGSNTHLHIFFAHRDPSNNLWYFFDPYGIYGTPDCYPSTVDGGHQHGLLPLPGFVEGRQAVEAVRS